MKYFRNLAIVAALAAMCSLSAFARDKNQHSVDINDPVQVGTTQLQPGTYKVEWQGAGPDVQVNFIQRGKTIATVPGTLKTNDDQVLQDDIIMDSSNKTIHEIDFHRGKEALVFAQNGM